MSLVVRCMHPVATPPDCVLNFSYSSLAHRPIPMTTLSSQSLYLFVLSHNVFFQSTAICLYIVLFIIYYLLLLLLIINCIIHSLLSFDNFELEKVVGIAYIDSCYTNTVFVVVPGATC